MRLMIRTLTPMMFILLAACGQQDAPPAPVDDAATADTTTEGAPDVVSEQTEAPTSQAEVPVHPSATAADWTRDYHSYANLDDVRITHSALDLDVNFEARQLEGTVEHHFEVLDPESTEIVLDSRDLTINGVEYRSGDEADWQAAEFEVAEEDAWMGSAVRVAVPAGTDRLKIDYASSPGASGLQWLDASLTASGEQPYLFSQSQAIHARSWIPLQDSPGVRFTYEATLRVPEAMLALMSARNPTERSADGEYRFVMEQPIPSYLMAIAAGDIDYQAMSDRTAVYAEKQLIEASAAEFEDTEQMIVIGEDMYGPYRWEDYDLLILPPSFPFGGMENPRLSYITPTVIAGDKSLVALIAHELAHSWSGNLVTNATWRDFWLNEGFTSYFENRIMEELYGKDRAAMERTLAYQGLHKTIEELDARDEILAVDLRGRDPDDGFHAIPYDKGSLFLLWLETQYGREAFDAFLREYFDHFAFNSINTEQFVNYLQAELLDAIPGVVSREQINEWIYEPGLPEGHVVPQSEVLTRLDSFVAGVADGELGPAQIDASAWSTQEWLYFLNNLPRELPSETLSAMDEQWQLTQSRNNEIAHSWLLLAVLNEYEAAYPRLRDYLQSIGRNKLVAPLYAALAQGNAMQQAMAKEVFTAARSGYHPITVKVNEPVVFPATED